MKKWLFFKSKYVILVSLFLSLSILSANNKLDSLLIVLDEAIENTEQYTMDKQKRIEKLKFSIPKTTILENKFKLYKDIYTEYKAFVTDSSYHYSLQSLALAEHEKNHYWINESKLQISHTLTISGMYPEAIETLNTIQKETLADNQLVTYFSNYYYAYNEWSEYAEYNYVSKYKKLAEEYQNHVLNHVKHETFEYAMEYSWKYIQEKDYYKAKKLLFSYLTKVEPNTRSYAMLTSVIGILYWYLDEMEMHKEYLAISAISDIKAAVKENTSLRGLANLIYNEGGDLARASNYIKKSLEDANFFNARLRSIQISRVYPLIENAYQLEREHQKKRLQTLLILASVLSVLLIFTIVFIIRQFYKLSEARKLTLVANEKLQSNNNALAEANNIKEEYIGRFLNQCSIYIEKMGKHHRILNKKAKEGNLTELYQLLKSNQFIDDELKDFYQNFDSVFLNLFPNFVKHFNELLLEKERIILKSGERMNTELRIFALMRLGITDSQKIAEFLRYSVTTIYNYRSKYRIKSVCSREEFENKVMTIGSL